MSVTEWKNPTIVENDDSEGSTEWINLSGVLLNDSAADESPYGGPYSLNPSPDGGIYKDYLARIIVGGSLSNEDKSTNSTLSSSLFEWVYYGGEDSLWLESISRNDVQSSSFGFAFKGEDSPFSTTNILKVSGFGFSIPRGAVINGVEVRVYVRAIGSDVREFQVDSIQMRVHYTGGDSHSPIPGRK